MDRVRGLPLALVVVPGDAGDADALVVCVFLVVAVDLVEKTRKDSKRLEK